MDITLLGFSSFRIRGKSATLVTDPYSQEETGVKFPKHVETDICTLSWGKEKDTASVLEGTPFYVQGPGEYDIKGVGVVGITVTSQNDAVKEKKKSTIYRIEIDDIVIVHLGLLDHILSSKEIDELDGVDIVTIPLGNPLFDAATAAKLISDIEPMIVLPMAVPQKVKEYPVADFCKALNKESVTQAKLSITKAKIPAQMEVIVLE